MEPSKLIQLRMHHVYIETNIPFLTNNHPKQNHYTVYGI